MIEIINCDIFKSECEIICHQVNCMGVMGSGLALQIKNKYPFVFYKYKQELSNNNLMLGKIQPVELEDITIINIFSQYNYGAYKCHTDYRALEHALYDILDYCNKSLKTSIAFPYKLGCDRGGGDWNIVYGMIDKIFGDSKYINCKICKLNKENIKR